MSVVSAICMGPPPPRYQLQARAVGRVRRLLRHPRLHIHRLPRAQGQRGPTIKLPITTANYQYLPLTTNIYQELPLAKRKL